MSGRRAGLYRLARPRGSTARLNAFAERLEAENRRMLDAMLADENRPRDWKVTVSGSDGELHVFPLRCSRKQVRKVKIAIHDAGGDALAVEAAPQTTEGRP